MTGTERRHRPVLIEPELRRADRPTGPLTQAFIPLLLPLPPTPGDAFGARPEASGERDCGVSGGRYARDGNPRKGVPPASVREAEAALGIDKKAIEAKVKAELKAKAKKAKAAQAAHTEAS